MLRAGRRCGSNEMGIPLQRLPHQKQPLPVCSPLEKATASQAFPLEQLLQGKCCSITCQLYRWMAVLVIQGQLSVWLTEGSNFMMSICPDRAYRQWLSSWVNPFNIWLAIDYGLPYACVLPKSSSLLFLTYILECSRWYTLVFDVFFKPLQSLWILFSKWNKGLPMGHTCNVTLCMNRDVHSIFSLNVTLVYIIKKTSKLEPFCILVMCVPHSFTTWNISITVCF